jgi:hypothetical protein
MKKIELTAEFILEKMTMGFQTDGKGNVSIQVDTVCGGGFVEMCLVELALSEMGINVEPDQLENVDGEFEAWEWTFPIEAVREHCPNLYNKFVEQNNVNSLFS